MSIQRNEFVRFIKLLNDNDCLSHVILVGSWAEFIYRETGLLQGFEPNIKTLDVDFLLKNLRRPSPPKNLIDLVKKDGYLVKSDILTNVTKIYDKSGIEIEFLLQKRGAGLESSLRTNLGVTAQTLRHLDIISNNAIEVSYMNMRINIPQPEAYAIHKIVINEQRGAKQEKDKQAIINIWPYLDRLEIERILSTLTKKETIIASRFIAENLI